jgi:hypothetical protein
MCLAVTIRQITNSKLKDINIVGASFERKGTRDNINAPDFYTADDSPRL